MEAKSDKTAFLLISFHCCGLVVGVVLLLDGGLPDPFAVFLYPVL